MRSGFSPKSTSIPKLTSSLKTTASPKLSHPAKTPSSGDVPVTSIYMRTGYEKAIARNKQLVNAVCNHQLDEAKKLLDTGGDPNFRDAEGLTLLHLAIYENHMDMIQLLLEYKPEISAIGGDMKMSPLDVAIDLCLPS
jgi:ankyrin repeat protein